MTLLDLHQAPVLSIVPWSAEDGTKEKHPAGFAGCFMGLSLVVSAGMPGSQAEARALPSRKSPDGMAAGRCHGFLPIVMAEASKASDVFEQRVHSLGCSSAAGERQPQLSCPGPDADVVQRPPSDLLQPFGG